MPSGTVRRASDLMLTLRQGYGVSATARNRSKLLVSVCSVLLGVVVIWIGLRQIGDQLMVVRVLATLGGVGLIYKGATTAVAVVWQKNVDSVFWLAVVVLILIVVLSLVAPLLPLSSPTDSAAALSNPIYLRPDLLSNHPLGTNGTGLDMLSRTIFGARLSLSIGLLAVLSGGLVGGLVGMVGGFLEGLADRTLQALTNVLLAFPPLVLLIIIATALPRSVYSIGLALGVIGLPVYARLARSSTVLISRREYVAAALSLGASRRRVLMREVLPEVFKGLLSYSLVMFGVMIVASASLSFLGLGIAPPTPTWGNMIAEGQNGVFEANPHIVLVPAAALFVTVFAAAMVGERLRQRYS